MLRCRLLKDQFRLTPFPWYKINNPVHVYSNFPVETQTRLVWYHYQKNFICYAYKRWKILRYFGLYPHIPSQQAITVSVNLFLICFDTLLSKNAKRLSQFIKPDLSKHEINNRRKSTHNKLRRLYFSPNKILANQYKII